MTDRLEFEREAENVGYNVRKVGAGLYFYDDTEMAWELWQAARAQSRQGAEPVAWLHQSRPETDVITDAVKRCWGHILPKHMQYSIPLYTHPQPAQHGSVPEGWKLVPVEPTATMISAFEHAPCAENYTDAATLAWEAMLDATPQPPQEGE